MAIIGQNFIPSEVLHQIFSPLDFKSIGRVQQVCTSFNNLAGDDAIWQNLFKRAFDINVQSPHVRNSIVRNEKELNDRVVTFLCSQKWEKKISLRCIIADKTYPSIEILQSFGPRRGTLSGFSDSQVDETKYLYFVGDVHLLPKGKYQPRPRRTYDNEDLPYIVGECQPQPYRTYEDIPPIPCETLTHSNILIKTPFESYFEADVEGVDVGHGNTLGYFSSINQWKEPFELFCVSGSDGRPKWTGRIPFSDYKFVKIDPKGNITWENIGENRHWTRAWAGRQGWKLYLLRFPVSFA